MLWNVLLFFKKKLNPLIVLHHQNEAPERKYSIEELDDGEEEKDMEYDAEERSTVGSFFHSLIRR